MHCCWLLLGCLDPTSVPCIANGGTDTNTPTCWVLGGKGERVQGVVERERVRVCVVQVLLIDSLW